MTAINDLTEEKSATSFRRSRPDPRVDPAAAQRDMERISDDDDDDIG